MPDDAARFEDAADLVKTHAGGSATGLIITGDIAYAGKREEYQRAGEWLDRLAVAIGCAKTAVQVVPGTFDKPYQIRLSYLRGDMGKDESIDRIARYMFKFRAQFSDNLYAKEVGLRAKYKELYPAPLMREYVKLIHSLKVNNGFKGFRFKYN